MDSLTKNDITNVKIILGLAHKSKDFNEIQKICAKHKFNYKNVLRLINSSSIKIDKQTITDERIVEDTKESLTKLAYVVGQIENESLTMYRVGELEKLYKLEDLVDILTINIHDIDMEFTPKASDSTGAFDIIKNCFCTDYKDIKMSNRRAEVTSDILKELFAKCISNSSSNALKMAYARCNLGLPYGFILDTLHIFSEKQEDELICQMNQMFKELSPALNDLASSRKDINKLISRIYRNGNIYYMDYKVERCCNTLYCPIFKFKSVDYSQISSLISDKLASNVQFELSTALIIRDNIGMIKSYQLEPGRVFEKVNRTYRHLIEAIIRNTSSKDYAEYLQKKYIDLENIESNATFDKALHSDLLGFELKGVTRKLTKNVEQYLNDIEYIKKANIRLKEIEDSPEDNKRTLSTVGKHKEYCEKSLEEEIEYIEKKLDKYAKDILSE